MPDTIFALSSPPGRGGVAVVRLSGPQALSIAELLTRGLAPPRKAALRRILWQGQEIDQALVLVFRAPRSFTGEDVVEFHLHGGRAIREALFDALLALGARPAGRGEFTRRAVENGKLDLTKAEAIADLIEAETPAQLRQALRQHDGALAQLCEDWRQTLIVALGCAEAAIDFSDDGVDEAAVARARATAHRLLQAMESHLAQEQRGEMLREGLRVTILGPPNAGKSSLLNALARRDVAIVSEHAGTTRDVLEVRLKLGGYLLLLADTAGVRPSEDALEQEGMRRALAHAQEGLRLLVLDGSLSDPRAGLPSDLPEPDLTVWNKSDLGFYREGVCVSVKTGAGIDQLIEALTSKVCQRLESQEAPLLSRPRHRHAVIEAHQALTNALGAPQNNPELLAEDLRLALRSIGRITGLVDVEELLDFVFRDFCIGK